MNTDSMEKPSLLLIGADGQLGRAVRSLAVKEKRTFLAVGRQALDITARHNVIETVEKNQPKWVINAAAYTAVDRAESEPQKAFAVNADGAANIAEACARIGAKMVQISTDYVFDGAKGTPYLPDDEPSPLNVYGESKLVGERKVDEILGSNALILRTAWVYSLLGPSFLTTMLRLMKERDAIHVVEDQVGSPTSALSLARAVLLAIERGVAGVQHWSDAGVASWYDFAVAIAEEALAIGLLDRMPTVDPVSSRNYPTTALRPGYSVLDRTRTRSAIAHNPRHWRKELRCALSTD